MLEINLFDYEFIHTEQSLGYITCSDTIRPKTMRWVNGLMEYNGATVFTDGYINSPIVDKVKCNTKIAWLLEPRAIHPNIYEEVIINEDKFDYILTHDVTLLSRGDKYVKSLVGQSRVEVPLIYPKTKILSMIASNKTISDGHMFRHEIAHKLGRKYNIDMWGSGYKYFTDKIAPLGDYYFSISVMNSKVDNFFTEVLIDNFRVGTVPIFWGCPNISEYFDERGIITFDTLDDLDRVLGNLTFEDYVSRLDYIKNNMELSEKYISTDDIIGNIILNLDEKRYEI